jgi:hypothetical protein
MLSHSRPWRFFSTPVRALLLVALAATAGHGLLASAAPVTPVVEQTVTASVSYPSPSVTTGGALAATVLVTLAVPAEYVEVRLRLYSPTGALLYQKTELRPGSRAGQLTVPFTRALTDFTAREGRYPVEVRVLATGAQPTEVESRLLVVNADQAPVPVAVIARISGVPAVDPEGRFVVDPERELGARTDAVRLAELLGRRAGRDLSIAIAPRLLEEWAQAAAGYETTGPAGVRQVPASSDAALAAADTLRRLRELATAAKAEFLDVPYADPDLSSMAAHALLGDLQEHWVLGDAIVSTALGAEPSGSAAVLGDLVPADALPLFAERGTRTILVAPESIAAGDTTATSGVYDLGSGLRAVVPDSRLAEAAAAGDSDAFYDVIFERLASEDGAGALAIVIDLGPGFDQTARVVDDALTWLDAAAWTRAATLHDAANISGPAAASLIASPPPPEWPGGYWDDVAAASRLSRAAVAALGGEDADALTARTHVLTAESLSWTAKRQSDGTIERGRDFATTAADRISGIFSTVAVVGSDVTLANRAGRVPISITNGSGRPLDVVVVVTAPRVRVTPPPEVITLDAGENVISVPVDMHYEISDRLKVRILAADVELGSTEFTVRASYLDRLAWVGIVVLFLIGMLVFIRRRVRTVIAGTIAEDTGAGDA